MSHIQEIEKLFERKFEMKNFALYCKEKDIPATTNYVLDFLRSSHLKYLLSKKKELEGEIRICADIGGEKKYRDNYFYNLAKQEEIDKINREIQEIK